MRSWLNLLRSMRFAVAILTVVAVAATIGSILEQSQGMAVYIASYGEFWAELLSLAGLTDIYHAWWFFTLLAFMASSTALCLAQNTPQMLYEMRTYREHKSLQALRRLPCSSEMDVPLAARAMLPAKLQAYLRRQGYAYISRKPAGNVDAILFAARRGGARRLGYLLVHAAIVLICGGGLIDGNVVLRWQLLSGSRHTESRDLPPSQVPARSRLGADAGSFRATMNLVEGRTENSAYLSFNDGYLLQELPFSVRLKRFRVEHYDGFDSGRPRDFASDIDIIDGGKVVPVTLHVNHPYTYRGISLYQSGFADGGSQLELQAVPLHADAAPAALQGKVGGTSSLLMEGQPVTLEFTEFRANNVFEKEPASQAGDARPTNNWFSTHEARSRVEDVGPSLAFRLRDGQGQAADWLVYRKPIQVDGMGFLVIGKREPQQDSMHYLRLPLDGINSLDSYLRLSRGLAQAEARRRAAHQIAADVADPALAAAFEKSTLALLDVFALHGYRGLADLVQNSVPPAERLKAGRFYNELLERAAYKLQEVPMVPPTPLKDAREVLPKDFLHAGLAAYSDSMEQNFSTLFRFTGYRQVNASGLQLTRAPGAFLVYLGAAMLGLGVCAMYFIRERRMWLWFAPDSGTLLIAFSANRDTPALKQEFDGHHSALLALASPAPFPYQS
ncbi:cytochrome c biogenesis protein ResB [Undibacterium sp. TJN25]|uniref:cytochrome c biogenesis protein ResB n=1 Tax=Undibacterium sp. TJN25 TaxID=3413056 RepID=UPI003BF0C260